MSKEKNKNQQADCSQEDPTSRMHEPPSGLTYTQNMGIGTHQKPKKRTLSGFGQTSPIGQKHVGWGGK